MWILSKLCVLQKFKSRFITQFRVKSSGRDKKIDNYRTLKDGTSGVQKRDMGRGEIFLPVFPESKMGHKIALVTGGTDDFGLLCVKELLKCGTKAIMIADIDENGGKEVICKLSKEFGENRAAFIKTDIADTKLLRNAFNWTRKHFKNIDIVVNIAKQVHTESWVEQVEKNVKGIIRGTLLGLEYMGTHNGGRGGAVLNMIAAPTLDDNKECPVFVGARHYIIGFGRAMSNQYYKDTAVKVVTLCAVEDNLESANRVEKDSPGCNLANLALLAKTGTVWTNI
nr:15-hydroxyprostaglandin dehydrogenase [NAD(+)]-like isoform X2 [Leptinotarsa decemlineata]